MARSIKPSVYIQVRKNVTGYRTYRVRIEARGRELPSISCGPDRRLAERVRDEWKSKLWHRRLRVPAPGEILTLAQFAQSDRARRALRYAPSTVAIEARALSLFGDFYGSAPIRDIDRGVVHDFEAWLRATPWRRGAGKARARQTNGILVLLRALKAALRRALKEGHLDVDPFFGYEMPPEEDVANPPSREGARELWKHLKPQAKVAVTVDLALGLRRGELFNIGAKNLQAPNSERNHWLVTVQKSKTRRGRVEHKTMALPGFALAALESLKPWPANGPILRLHPSTLSHAVSEAGRLAGLGRVRLHDLRHRWATELMVACRDEYALMDVGGWTTRAAVKRYQHPTPARRDVTLQLSAVLPHTFPTHGGGGKTGVRKNRKKSSI